ncbi:cobyrinate a,c-diamide synthase [Sporomusa acidovorans]|uniref:Cobyrinate a,c-diamide synthase n=1 Tax=Sporomusa acidovorans (strain ATCC 49682 / DSM 3132 / Mol) TaxID=1123286 RepID=A0ABZ3J127_SPOA4|nr:cobyrinate a,c-diamide synthase [Sporomusa acidovorans]OZC15056.1 cobyrinic acid A,C-diamide synthase [Sporomusa acidovorans DSM 3132]SDE84779.1 cobyrinic acid a,c-diamide synthase [Sporomusa acidovorans]
MGQLNIPRVVIAGVSSGVGKTTIVTGLLAALTKRGVKVQSYKVGPDYIDPGFHRLASGKSAHNLDTWLVPPESLSEIFASTAQGNDIAVIEGVMGLFDGGRFGVSSTAAVAKLLQAPVILVIDAKSMGESAAAIALGFKTYDPEVNLAGVIINRLGSESHKLMVCEALERVGIPVIGTVFRNQELTMPERHLGLTPVTEQDAAAAVSKMGQQMAEQVALPELLALAKTAGPLWQQNAVVKGTGDRSAVRIGVAQDEVFSFYYPSSLQVLTEYGAELVYFSPLNDRQLPAVDGIVLGGGFPEMFVKELSANAVMRNDILQAAKRGMPIYAECGGLMYLARQITDFDGRTYDMAGVIPAACSMQSKLETVGYVKTRALTDNVLCACGESLRGHEFHFSRMVPDGSPEEFPWAFEFKKMRTGALYQGGYASGNILASYLHMHFAGNRLSARRFVDRCTQYMANR